MGYQNTNFKVQIVHWLDLWDVLLLSFGRKVPILTTIPHKWLKCPRVLTSVSPGKGKYIVIIVVPVRPRLGRNYLRTSPGLPLLLFLLPPFPHYKEARHCLGKDTNARTRSKTKPKKQMWDNKCKTKPKHKYWTRDIGSSYLPSFFWRGKTAGVKTKNANTKHKYETLLQTQIQIPSTTFNTRL